MEKSNNSFDKTREATSGQKDKKGKSKPHPARSEIIKTWEAKFGQPYENSLSGNQAINQIIRHLDKLIRKAREDDISEEDIARRISDLWKVILSNWDKLEKFYRNLIRFESIAKYLTEIINQIKEYGINSKQSKQSTYSNGQKPSFDRFRSKNGSVH